MSTSPASSSDDDSPQDDLGEAFLEEQAASNPSTPRGAFQDALDRPDEALDPDARPWSNKVVLATVAFGVILATYSGLFWVRSVSLGLLLAAGIVGATAGNLIKSRPLALNSHRLLMLILVLSWFGSPSFVAFPLLAGQKLIYDVTRYQGLTAAERKKLEQVDAEKAERRRRNRD